MTVRQEGENDGGQLYSSRGEEESREGMKRTCRPYAIASGVSPVSCVGSCMFEWWSLIKRNASSSRRGEEVG